MRRGMATALLALAGVIAGCDDKGKQASRNSSNAVAETGSAPVRAATVTAAMGKAADLGIANRLFGVAKLGTALDGKGSYTIFAPVDTAWSTLNAAQFKSLDSPESRPQLIAILRQHIAPGTILAADLDQGLKRKNGAVTLATMGARPISLRRQGSAILLGQGDGAPRILGAPIMAGNDVLYRIDRLIPPPS